MNPREDVWEIQHNLDYMGRPDEWSRTGDFRSPMTFEDALMHALIYRGNPVCQRMELQMRIRNMYTHETVDVNAIEVLVG